MLQSFEDRSDPSQVAARVEALRSAIAGHGLEGYLVPRADEHQGEYVPRSAERLLWLTGFSGSAGMAAVLRQKAAIFVDGRYTVQARGQVDTTVIDVLQVPEAKLTEWLGANAPKGGRIGYDPRLHTIAAVEALERVLAEKGLTLVAVAGNLVDAVWPDRPSPPLGAVVPHPDALAGRSAADKIADLRATLAKAGEDAVVLTNPDSIAWLLNIRGADVPRTPFALSFVIAPCDGRPQWFVAAGKVGDNVRGHVAAVADVRPPEALDEALVALGAAKSCVRLDPDWTARDFLDRLTAAGATVSRAGDPCLLPKARKNEAELAGARAAHRRDARAVIRFLAWLDREAPKGGLDEIAAAMKLEEMRHETGALLDLSFETISAAGPHAALPHYRVSRKSCLPITPGSVYLVDSGGQYRDGTTDITRTIAVGQVPEEARERFTLVLKGMIAVSTLRFPVGTRGSDVDPFARRALWARGFDFDHGTGHGIGSYLSVHEGPQRIARTGSVPLEPGMIVSNEPGYYREGAYGIRIENLLVVTKPEVPAGGERAMMGFETLTLAPIDRAMMVPELMSDEEVAWLDDYHRWVMSEIGPELDGADHAFLERATRPLHTGA